MAANLRDIQLAQCLEASMANIAESAGRLWKDKIAQDTPLTLVIETDQPTKKTWFSRGSKANQIEISLEPTRTGQVITLTLRS